MDDRFRADKPPRRTTSHPGQFSLGHPSVGRRGEYQGSKQAYRIARIRGLAVLAGALLRDSETEISAEVREAPAH